MTEKPLFCLEIWGSDYNKIKNTCLLAEKLGYYGFYYGESLTDLDLDCWTILSALLYLTRTIKLGPVITYLLPPYRSIGLIAKQAITFQEISGGRLVKDGSRGTLQYATQWWYPYRIDYPETVKRVSMFNESINALKMLLDYNKTAPNVSPSVYFAGKYFKLNGCSFTKSIKKIPITIAANKNKMEKIAAQYSDVWES